MSCCIIKANLFVLLYNVLSVCRDMDRCRVDSTNKVRTDCFRWTCHNTASYVFCSYFDAEGCDGFKWIAHQKMSRRLLTRLHQKDLWAQSQPQKFHHEDFVMLKYNTDTKIMNHYCFGLWPLKMQNRSSLLVQFHICVVWTSHMVSFRSLLKAERHQIIQFCTKVEYKRKTWCFCTLSFLLCSLIFAWNLKKKLDVLQWRSVESFV